MKNLNSISQVNKVYSTAGSEPVLVLCSDLEFYVCKYKMAIGGSAEKLFREYLGACFLKEWSLLVPDFAFVEISEHHIKEFLKLQPHYFQTTCFGSKYIRDSKEFDNFFVFLQPSDKKLFNNKFDFLKIGLFDIWISNEDRHTQNYNLLLNFETFYDIIPIDHSEILNSGNLDKGLNLIPENESIISSPLTRKLFTKKELKDKSNLQRIEEDYYFCIEKCKDNIDEITQNIPDDWHVNIEKQKELLHQELFKTDWIESVFSQFISFVQSQIN